MNFCALQGTKVQDEERINTLLPLLLTLSYLIDDEEDIAPRFQSEGITVKDHLGISIMYDVALRDFETLEQDMLRIGTHYISSKKFKVNGPPVDRASILEDLYEQEYLFQQRKQKLMECYVEIYEHILDPIEQQRVAQIMVNLVALRPALDLGDSYFVASYQAHSQVLEAERELWRELINSHIDDQSFLRVMFKVKTRYFLVFD